LKPAPQSKSPRKRIKRIKSTSKAVYREDQFFGRLRRYTDRERVLSLHDSDAIEDLPSRFFANPEGHTACRVTVDWLGIRAGLEASIDTLGTGRTSHVTAERLSEMKEFRSREAVFYVLEFLPEVIESALANLYVEALLKVSVDRGSRQARSAVEDLGKMDYDARIKRLEIQEGPKRRFQHRSQYERALKKAMQDLLREERGITQETVAEKLSQESQPLVDVREIRRWNKEFGVNWAMKVEAAIKADKSS